MSEGLGVAVAAVCVFVIVGTHAWARQSGLRRRLGGALVALAMIATISALYFTNRIGDRTFGATMLLSVIATTVYDVWSGRRRGKGDAWST